MTDTTREAWLVRATHGLIRLFDLTPRGPFRITCGWPSRRGTAARSRTIGECFSSSSSADGTIEIIITIALDDPVEVLAVAVHELLHAHLPEGVGHRAPFARKAREIGLEGKPTATRPGPAFIEAIGPILEELGPYPHGRLLARDLKKQSTRMLKAECPFCGYAIRLTRKWLEVAIPRCPVHECEMAV